VGRRGHRKARLPLGGRTVTLDVQRVRVQDGGEVTLTSVARFQSRDVLAERVIKQILSNVSTRGYEGTPGKEERGQATPDSPRGRQSRDRPSEALRSRHPTRSPGAPRGASRPIFRSHIGLQTLLGNSIPSSPTLRRRTPAPGRLLPNSLRRGPLAPFSPFIHGVLCGHSSAGRIKSRAIATSTTDPPISVLVVSLSQTPVKSRDTRASERTPYH
jgi:hypothetical protein